MEDQHVREPLSDRGSATVPALKNERRRERATGRLKERWPRYDERPPTAEEEGGQRLAEGATRGPTEQETWMAELKSELGDFGWEKFVEEGDGDEDGARGSEAGRDGRTRVKERGLEEGSRARKEALVAAAAAGLGKGKRDAGVKGRPTAPAPPAAGSSEAFWAATVGKAKQLAGEVEPAGARAGKGRKKETTTGRPDGKVKEEKQQQKEKKRLTPAESQAKGAARKARTEELRATFIAKLKAEHGAEWEEKLRDSDQRKAWTAERNREFARLAKMVQQKEKEKDRIS